ncbi:MAG: hypothetical protein AVDCRST_MAG33-1675 [uncultured Thermomicrobiales bacterium]|uniref:Uncharacterized protein n=1 Tax=uncultured Thermomicrobiales bacterium TaxID=1645740 RepID=A0A6J4UWC2_9BACT|nr:MAG: hypothetical protein AVDCRST_MAG33-1675 [uncultured Thermomicrobiales bacterium]
MEMNIKQRIAAAALALALLGGTAVPALAQDGNRGQQGGARGLVAAVVQVADTLNFNDTNVEVVTVDINDSFNNLTALNNILNNSPILNNFLNNNNVEIIDVVDIGDVDVNILNGLNVELDDVLGVVLLSTGDILVLV